VVDLTLIRPIVAYGAETWTLTVTEENALRRFEMKVLWKIYGPVMDKGLWRMRYNFELYLRRPRSMRAVEI
jgi:hypothetical protein